MTLCLLRADLLLVEDPPPDLVLLAPDLLGRLGPLHLLEGGELRLDLHPLLDEAAGGLLIVLLPLLALLPEVSQVGLTRVIFSSLRGRLQDLGRLLLLLFEVQDRGCRQRNREGG